MRRSLVILLVSCAPLLAEEFDPEVYLTEDQALAWAFPKAQTVEREDNILSSEIKARAEKRLGWKIDENRLTVFLGKKEGKTANYAVITEEIGMVKPISFIVKVNPEGKVEDVAVMVYRESRGGEVRRRRFLYQYKGKKAQSPLRINRDIIGITGATLSVRGISAGIKKVLVLLEELGYTKARQN